MKLFFKIVFVIFIVFILAAGGGIFYLTRGLESGSQLIVNDVNLSLIDDGIYTGKYNAGRWTNEVRIEIQDHKITAIKLVNDLLFSKTGMAEELFNKVVEKQSIDIDITSGATVTSKAYLKSIENALNQAP